jgi:hypothetical protein
MRGGRSVNRHARSIDRCRCPTEIIAVHELALIEYVIDAIRERLGEARVVRVRLEIGRLRAVVPDAVRFSFEICAEGTTLAGAVLEIDETAGDELRIKEVEVA